MSDSKAALAQRCHELEAELAKYRADVIFLLQGLWRIAEEHPEVDLPEMGGNRFDEGIWRHVC